MMIHKRLFLFILIFYVQNGFVFAEVGFGMTGAVKKKAQELHGKTESDQQRIISKNQFTWSIYGGNPVISYGQEISNLIWNDPSVIKEGNLYKMWLSGGTGFGINTVRMYYATSSNGLNWEIQPTPVLEPGISGEWDDDKTETPDVIKVGSVYHMYYSGRTASNNLGAYHIGHATSNDGLTWVKDPNNPIISFTNDSAHFGFYTAAEPGVTYKNGVFYLYYSTFIERPGYVGDLAKIQGICLATSNDGSTFTHYDSDNDGYRDAVLTQSVQYSVSSNYIGYSTPYSFIDSLGRFHLFYDVAIHPNGDSWRQVALAHAISDNGISFQETEFNFIEVGDQSWLGTEVRAPSVIQDGSVFKMWFAGHTDVPSTGIGYAVGK